MSKRYNKYYNNNYFNGNQDVNDVEPEETIDVVGSEDVSEESTVVEPEVHPDITRAETTEVPKEEVGEIPKSLYGINNCKKLNVRTEPNKDADIVCVLDVTNTFEIEELESNSEWVKVFFEDGNTGFCMKQYVAIK